jgi:hypothetical protein
MLNQVVLVGNYRYKTPEGFVMELEGDDIYVHDPSDTFFSVGAVQLGATIAIKGKVKGITKLGNDLFEEHRSVIHLERISVMRSDTDINNRDK